MYGKFRAEVAQGIADVILFADFLVTHLHPVSWEMGHSVEIPVRRREMIFARHATSCLSLHPTESGPRRRAITYSWPRS
jgi:hypothetical protein